LEQLKSVFLNTNNAITSLKAVESDDIDGVPCDLDGEPITMNQFSSRNLYPDLDGEPLASPELDGEPIMELPGKTTLLRPIKDIAPNIGRATPSPLAHVKMSIKTPLIAQSKAKPIANLFGAQENESESH
jgi:hypothetical protein